nr:hypothetical protein [Lactobacillus johnsonii]
MVKRRKSCARKRRHFLKMCLKLSMVHFLRSRMPAVQHFLHLTVYPLIAEGDFNASLIIKLNFRTLQVNGPVKIEYQVISEDESKPSFKVQLLVNGEKVSEDKDVIKKLLSSKRSSCIR